MKSSGEEKLSRDSVMNATCTNPPVHCFTQSQSRGAHRGIAATGALGVVRLISGRAFSIRKSPNLCTTPLVCRKCRPREMSSAIDLPGPAHVKALSSRVVSACRRSPPCTIQAGCSFCMGVVISQIVKPAEIVSAISGMTAW